MCPEAKYGELHEEWNSIIDKVAFDDIDDDELSRFGLRIEEIRAEVQSLEDAMSYEQWSQCILSNRSN